MSRMTPAFTDLPIGLAEAEELRVGRVWIFIASIAVIFIAAVEGTIMSTAMPAIVGALGGFEFFTWTFAAYFLAQAATIPIYGGLADVHGRKPVLLVGIALFLLGSLLCGLAWNMPSLIAFRVIQGLGAGALVTLAQTIIGDFYKPVERAKLQGYISGAWAVGAVFGPIIGGGIVAHTVWAWVFWINIPIGLAAAAMILAALHEKRSTRVRGIDFVGSALMASGTTVLMFVLVQTNSLGTIETISLLAVAATLIIAFVVHESRTREPMLPPALLRNRIVACGSIVSLASGAVLIGSSAFLSLYLQGVMGLSALLAGFAVGAPSLSWPFASFIGGRLLARLSYRTTAIIGVVPLALGTLMLIAMSPESSPAFAAVGPLLIGFGFGFIIPTFLVAIQSNVDWEQRGIATSATVFSRIIGQAIGTAVFGGILNASVAANASDGGEAINAIMDATTRRSMAAGDLDRLTHTIASGLHHVYLVLGVLIVVTAVSILALPIDLRAQNKATK
jgi:EmrB/QacA subfamily drug resistance transporter